MNPYQPRPVSFVGVESIRGFRLKSYSIRFGDQAFERERFVEGMRLAEACLPSPASNDERPGVGFVILHQGRTMDYLILCWWDRENELPTRVFLRTDEGWRLATGGESFCIWDLKVMAWEREAYVKSFLSGQADEAGYLANVISGVV